MKIVNSKLIPPTLSIDDVECGDIVLLGTGCSNDEITRGNWYAMAVGYNLEGQIESYVDLENGEFFNDIENYPIFQIIKNRDVQIVLPK